ncbi:unnamed protein product [Bursaphelenchus xylophilus]|uniref:(pine wood nematode) hypothetical protein n=1 Tax=Bursaphelenchus xylophilus TaxID=6326 RepID=A0A1I7SXA6_BURXY|nr:unnamed protein product [Bursaphelenchus xylophilus]CAG9100290.1 unnamed protein product [Bursaphelenchus xylophilus]
MIAYDVTRPCRNPRFRSWSPRFKVDCSRDIVKDNKRNQIFYKRRNQSLRKVPAFTIQTEQRHTRPFTPANAKPNNVDLTHNEIQFSKFYEDQRFPVRIVSNGKIGIEWLVDPGLLEPNEAQQALVRFSYGLPLEKSPFNSVALKGFMDLLTIEIAPQLIAETLPQIVPNIRKGLEAKKYEKRLEMLRVIRRLATLTGIGPLLIPFYRMLLPPLRTRFISKFDTDIGPNHRAKYMEEVTATLHCLQKFGGRHAYLNIKYIIPDYQKID